MAVNKHLNMAIEYDASMINQSDLIRFWQQVAKVKDSCWVWTGCCTKGYGCFSIGGGNKWIYAHRFSYWIHLGKIAAGLQVCHHCDNPSCVKPDHLFLGTLLDNQMDSRNKFRHRSKRTYQFLKENGWVDQWQAGK